MYRVCFVCVCVCVSVAATRFVCCGFHQIGDAHYVHRTLLPVGPPRVGLAAANSRLGVGGDFVTDPKVCIS
jgi:hypothetical protein